MDFHKNGFAKAKNTKRLVYLKSSKPKKIMEE